MRGSSFETKESTSADRRGTIHGTEMASRTPLPIDHRGRRTMAVHLSGRQRDFLTDTFPRPPGDGWTFCDLIQRNIKCPPLQ